MELPSIFSKYADLFSSNGFSLYLIGGTSRDIILGLEPEDFDFVTDATPEQMKSFLEDADYSFSRFGSIKVFDGGIEVDITTLREEGPYLDNRHPSFVKWTTSLEVDSKRRDFTVNALYIDKDGNIFDFHNGLSDLKEKLIRFIGDPSKRIEEDPLRIIRAERFAKRLGFSFEEKTGLALKEKENLVQVLNPEKVKMERRKK